MRARVITAGFPRKPGMSRDDLLWANYDIVKATVEQVVKYSPSSIFVLVTNPLDAHVPGSLQGQLGVPVKLGERGIEKVYQIRLAEDEKAALLKSAAAVQELVDVMKPKLG